MRTPDLTTTSSFQEASALVVDHLRSAVPLGYWAVTRFDGERQLYLEVRDDAYGLAAGDSHRWEDSLCIRMLDGEGPSVAPDAMAVPAYAAAGVARAVPIGAYVGVPLRRGDGSLFGTICGLDPRRQAPDLAEHEPLVELLSRLLGMILDADLERTDAARVVERLELVADTDVLTGLLNRRGWDRVCALEEARLQRFGDPTSVVVIDLDELKSINDRRGHAAGDRHLAAAAAALRTVVRDSDHLARTGGDEFAVLASRISVDEVGLLVDRLRDVLAEAGISASVGAAPYRIGGGLAAAVEEADAAMYEDKASRRRDRSEPTGTSAKGLPGPMRSIGKQPEAAQRPTGCRGAGGDRTHDQGIMSAAL